MKKEEENGRNLQETLLEKLQNFKDILVAWRVRIIIGIILITLAAGAWNWASWPVHSLVPWFVGVAAVVAIGLIVSGKFDKLQAIMIFAILLFFLSYWFGTGGGYLVAISDSQAKIHESGVYTYHLIFSGDDYYAIKDPTNLALTVTADDVTYKIRAELIPTGDFEKMAKVIKGERTKEAIMKKVRARLRTQTREKLGAVLKKDPSRIPRSPNLSLPDMFEDLGFHLNDLELNLKGV